MRDRVAGNSLPTRCAATPRKPVSSVNASITNFPTQTRTALAIIASNTGSSRPGDDEMMPRISAVAVCCSKASRVSVKSRAFSIAMTACAAKFCNSAICFSVNVLTSVR